MIFIYLQLNFILKYFLLATSGGVLRIALNKFKLYYFLQDILLFNNTIVFGFFVLFVKNFYM